MKKISRIVAVCLAVVLMACLFTGCNEEDYQIPVTLSDGFPYVFEIGGVTTGENGNTMVDLLLTPKATEDEKWADPEQLAESVESVPFTCYITIGGEKYEYDRPNSTIAIENDFSKGIYFIYSYSFKTKSDPDEIFVYLNSDPDNIWQFDPVTGLLVLPESEQTDGE